jgi:hypothetical protein
MSDLRRWAKYTVNTTTDDKAIAALTYGGLKVEDHVLVGNEGGKFSICVGHRRRGISSLLVEDEDEHSALVAFLMKREVRQYSTILEFADAIGWDRISRFDEP